VKIGDVVLTGCRKVPAAKVNKLVQQTGTAHVVTLRPGLSLVSTHPVKTKGGPDEGNWQFAKDHPEVNSVDENTFGTYFNVELNGHVDMMMVSGVMCSVLGTYCGPHIGWDKYTRKSTRCDEKECKDQCDHLLKRRCVICDMVCEDNKRHNRSPYYVGIPRAFRQARGHGGYGEPLIQSWSRL